MATRTCPECDGTGEDREIEAECRICGGDGDIEAPDPYADMTMAEALALDTAKLAALEDE